MRVAVLRNSIRLNESDVLSRMHTTAEALLTLDSCTVLDGGGVLRQDSGMCFELRFNQTYAVAVCEPMRPPLFSRPFACYVG